MDRNTIVEEVYKSGIVKKLVKHYQECGRITPNNAQDFEYEIYSIILNINEDKLQALYDNKQLEFYVVTIIKNQACNTLSTFNRQYADKRIVLAGDIPNNNNDYDIDTDNEDS